MNMNKPKIISDNRKNTTQDSKTLKVEEYEILGHGDIQQNSIRYDMVTII